jgi:hypothetical protein
MDPTKGTGTPPETAGATPPLKNDAQTQTVDPAEFEALKKKAEQAEMRANQLQNEAEARKKADEEAARKKLEEDEKWKDVAEQERLKREELEQQVQSQAQEKRLKAVESQLLSEFPQEVRELAETVGLSLQEDSEEAQTAFKDKLGKLAEKVPVSNPVGASNHSNSPRTGKLNREDVVMHLRHGTPEQKLAAIENIPIVQQMSQPHQAR